MPFSSGNAIAAVHAGWRGLCAGVVEAAVASVRRSGGDPAALVQAWIGPAIGPCRYEVGADVPRELTRTHPGAPDLILPAGGSLRFDLRRAARWLLEGAGVRVEHEMKACTACDARLFSHRRDGVTGRQGLLVRRPTAPIDPRRRSRRDDEER
ncbi:MAG: polyphenol oxidase family protein [Actinomycetota bacterium]